MRLDDIKIAPILSNEGDSEDESGIATVSRTKIKKPKLFKVLLHNDDYTTMEFVVMILKRVFAKAGAEAERVMLKVHQEGTGICGVYTHEIAETKTQKVLDLAKEHGHPLMCSFEEE